MISNLPSWANYGTYDESRFPELWESCIGAWAPCLGPTGFKLHDTSRRCGFGFLVNKTPANWQVDAGRYALDFDYVAGASREAVELSSVSSVRNQPFASISMWVNLQTAPSIQAGLYFEPTSSDGFTKFGLFQSTTNQIVFVARDTASGGSFAITATPTAGAWVHVCGTYNSVTDVMELFFNGVSAGTNTTAKGVLHDSAPASTIAIGAFTQAGSPTLQYSCSALIDDVRLSAKVLTPAEVRLLARDRGIAYQRRLRKSYFAEQIGSTFRAAWARNSNYIISPLGAA